MFPPGTSLAGPVLLASVPIVALPPSTPRSPHKISLPSIPTTHHHPHNVDEILMPIAPNPNPQPLITLVTRGASLLTAVRSEVCSTL